jgi:hypothetical protein
MSYWTAVRIRIIDQDRKDIGAEYEALRDEFGMYLVEASNSPTGEAFCVFKWEAEEMHDGHTG